MLFMCVNSYAQNIYAPKYTYRMYGDRTKWYVDSIFENQYKNKLLHKQIAYSKNLNTPVIRKTIYYYPNNKIRECYYEKFNTFSNAFEAYSRFIFNYKDSSEYYSSIGFYYDNENSVWVESKRTSYNRDEFKNTNSIQTYSLQGPIFELTDNNNFKFNYLQSNTNNDTILNKVTSYLNVNYSWGTTLFNSKWDAEFDEYDRITKRTTYSHSFYWEKEYVDSFDYNNTKNLIPYKIHRVENNNTVYIYDSLVFNTNFKEGFFSLNDLSKYVLSYKSNSQIIFHSRKQIVRPDSNGSTITSYQHYNTSTNKWVYSTRIYKIYNDDRKITDKYTASFNLNSNKFIPIDGFKYEYTYDGNGFLRDSIVKYVPFNSNTFENYVKFQYYNYELLTSIENEEIPIINLYPNPNSDGIFHINIPTAERVELYSIQGQLIRELNIEDYKIEIDNISNGMYILKIEALNKVYTQRISIVH
jgi:hypothetical protein